MGNYLLWLVFKVAIKVDFQVTAAKALNWCETKGNIPYFETSAKENINVEQAFLAAARNSPEQKSDPDSKLFTSIKFMPGKSEKSCAC